MTLSISRTMIFCIPLICILLCGCQTVKARKQNPQDLQSVLTEVKKSFNMQDVKVKYCPLCGKHYSGHLQTCIDDKTTLLPVE